MASDLDVSGFRSDRYFSRAWHLVTQEKGWWKSILLMGVALLVPIVGPLAVLGYQLEWARLLAWDVNEPMRRHDIHVGELIASGWRGFVAMLGWAIIQGLIDNALSEIPGIGGLLSLVWAICGIFISMMIMVAAIRATIYQKIGAGYSAKNLWEMGKRDLGGLARVWLISFVAELIQSIVCIAIFFVSAVAALPSILDDASVLYNYGSMMSERELAFYTFDLVGTFLGGIWPALLLIIAIVLFCGVLVCCLTFAGLALWMRQFDVAAWGKSSDPLPVSVVHDEAEKDTEIPVAPASPEPVEEKAPEAPVVTEVDEPATPVDAAPEAAVAEEPAEQPAEEELVPPIPGEQSIDDEADTAEFAEETATEVIAPARPAASAEEEFFDNDAATPDDEDLAEKNDDPASSDEEEPEE